MLHSGDTITLGLGQYRLHAPLASSSYGSVWRSDRAALKFINRAQMERARADQRERWIDSAHNEIAFLRSLAPWDERHIVRLLDTGSHDALPVMALELLDGDLASFVKAERSAGRPIALPLILGWLGQINQALAKVHQYGWRYLDLKPANVLLDARRRSVKLADFGTNRLLQDLHPHSYAGTANWQAPEQFFPTGEHRYETDARTDYFALGALFYYLVSGGLPLRFCSDCGHAYRTHQTGGAYVLREQNGRHIPATLREDEAALFVERIEGQGDSGAALDLLRALLHQDRSRRPQHAIDISRMLGAIRGAR
ncbi:MAG: protein kinase [Pseudomonadota bacterium]